MTKVLRQVVAIALVFSLVAPAIAVKDDDNLTAAITVEVKKQEEEDPRIYAQFQPGQPMMIPPELTKQLEVKKEIKDKIWEVVAKFKDQWDNTRLLYQKHKTDIQKTFLIYGAGRLAYSTYNVWQGNAQPGFTHGPLKVLIFPAPPSSLWFTFGVRLGIVIKYGVFPFAYTICSFTF
jgi:hypothetical protein